MKHNRVKETDIPPRVKREVWERDKHCCVLCGSPNAMPNAHFISRAKGGKGIKENILTLCSRCHFEYDNSPKRNDIKDILARYLIYCYGESWNEEDLIYKKYDY